jgi:TPR repeat protein
MTEFETGLAAVERGDYLHALGALLPLAEAGDPQAQLIIAGFYHAGLGMDADGMRAAFWYLKAAEQSVIINDVSGLAFHNLSTLYITGGPGVEPDKGLARLFRSKAQSLGVVFD